MHPIFSWLLLLLISCLNSPMPFRRSIPSLLISIFLVCQRYSHLVTIPLDAGLSQYQNCDRFTLSVDSLPWGNILSATQGAACQHQAPPTLPECTNAPACRAQSQNYHYRRAARREDLLASCLASVNSWKFFSDH